MKNFQRFLLIFAIPMFSLGVGKTVYKREEIKKGPDIASQNQETEYGYSAQEVLEQCAQENLEQPQAEPDGRIQTLNKKGACSPVIDDATQAFLTFGAGKKVLEVGGGYGLVMHKMLEQSPTTHYTLNDLEPRHLALAARSCPEKSHARFVPADFLDIDETQTYDAILIARVLHFMNPEKLEASFKKIKKLLKPGGQVFIVAITPYVKRYQNFIPVYEARLKKQDPYPGYVASLKDWLSDDQISESQRANISPDPFLFLDSSTLNRLAKEHELKILGCETKDLGYISQDWQYDGRENVILIAQQ